jgi:hypothetical protein
MPTRDVVEQMLRARLVKTPPGDVRYEGQSLVGKFELHDDHRSTTTINFDDIDRWGSSLYERNPFTNFAWLFTLRLDGKTRLALVEERESGDLSQQPPQNHLMALFRDDVARKRISNITADAFGKYFVIDPTGMKTLRIRMSDRAPADKAEEQSLDERARAFHAAAIEIVHLSDGIKAFTGLIAAVLSSDFRILLIDEPEAFLHPPLSRALGRVLTQLAAERDASVVAATHSPDFVMGCIQSGIPLNLVRLTFDGSIATARLLAPATLKTLMSDPLLRSTGVIKCLVSRSRRGMRG